jgi:hypothetical protein
VSEPCPTPLRPCFSFTPLFEDELCSLPELEDEHPSSEVLLYISYEVVSQLDGAEDYRLLSPEEQSLRYFLKD